MVKAPAPHAPELPLAFLEQFREETPRPPEVGGVRPRADECEVHAEARRPRGEPPVFRRVFLRRELAAASPGFVADTPEPHLERIAVTRGGAHVRERVRAGRGVAVFDPLVEILRRQAAQVRRKIRRAAGQAAQPRELVRPERVGILFPCAVRPLEHRRFVHPEVGPRRPPVRAADAVAPVVAVGKAAARPADGARRQAAHVIDQRLADASRVGDLRLLADPDAVVDDAAEMLDEVSVQIGRHRADAFVDQDLDARIGRV